MILSERIQTVKPSPTLTVAVRARELQNAGKDILNLSVGEPDFDTPEYIKEAAVRALHAGFTKYTPVDGIPGLKQAVSAKFARDNHLNYTLQEIIITNGCKQALYNAMLALLNPGDEVIIPAPYWVSYPDIAKLVGGTPVIIESSFTHYYKITPEQLKSAITPKTKAFIINSPSNPTGIAYTEKELAALAEVLLAHPDIFIISDDMYEYILWKNTPFKNIVNICPALKDRTIICHGVSKTYAMTGWRIGFAAGPKTVVSAMAVAQSQSTSNPNSIAQAAAQAGLEGDQHCVTEMRLAYEKRHQLVYDALSNLPGVKCHPADGTFYSFADVSGAMELLGKFTDDTQFAEYLLDKTGIVVIPGSAFGAPNCLRFSTAASEKVLKEAMHRMKGLFA